MPIPTYYNPYYQQPQFQTPQVVQAQPKYDFIPVQSENEARNYPVAAGNSVSFKDENAPYIYTKTMGLSQLSQPVFERYKLIKENDPAEAPNLPEKAPEDNKAVNNTIKELKSEIGAIWDEIEALKARRTSNAKKKDNGDD